MHGPGKYDVACTVARTACGPASEAVLIVLNGVHGDGFSVQASLLTLGRLPEILRQMASAIEEDLSTKR